MTKYLFITFLITALLWGASCERVPLETEYYETAVIPVSVDWSESLLNDADKGRFTAWFFPHNGNTPLSFVFEGSEGEAVLPIGKYSVIVINKTADDKDWETIKFKGIDKYETFGAYAIGDADLKSDNLYTKGEDKVINGGLEGLSAVSIKEFEVTADMVIISRNNEGTKITDNRSAEMFKPLKDIKPLPVTKRVDITINISNLNSAKYLSGALKNMTESILLADKSRSKDKVTQVVKIDDLYWNDEKKIDGKAKISFLSFGGNPAEDIKYFLEVNTLTHWGSRPPAKSYEITDYVIHEQNNTISIEIGTDDSDTDKVILPEFIDGTDVDDWDEDDVILN